MYLVQYYQHADDEDSAISKTEVVDEYSLWSIIDQAKLYGHRIIVYKVGKKLLDWSEPSND